MQAFFVNGSNYVNFSVDLGMLGFPSRYNVLVYVTTIEKDCTFIDFTDWLHIPPPDFTISASPSSVALRPGDNNRTELQVKSNTNLNSEVFIKPLFIKQSGHTINITPNPEKIAIPPYGMGTALLQMNATRHAAPNPYTIPVSTNISFPTALELGAFQTVKSPARQNISKIFYFTVTIQQPLDTQKFVGLVFASKLRLDTFGRRWRISYNLVS